MFVYAMLPADELVELCHAQYWVPKPVALLPVAVLITYWTCVFAPAVVLPKCAAALTASAASWLCVGWLGAAAPPSNHVPPRRLPPGFTAWTPLVPQVTVPDGRPWQYWVTELFHELPPTRLKKSCWMATSPDGSFDPFEPHWEPQ